MNSIFNFSVSIDFSGSFNMTNFVRDIIDSTISPTFAIGRNDDDVTVRFASNLTAEEETTLNNLVATHQGSPINTQYSGNAEDNSVSLTTSTNYQQKLRLTTDLIEAGDYKIEWSYNWTSSQRNVNFEARIELDDSITIREHFEEPISLKSSSQFTSQGFKIITLTRGIHTIDLDYRRSNNSIGISKIWNAVIQVSAVNVN